MVFWRNYRVEFNPHNTFNDYAFEWTPNYIKWFVNNTEVYQQNQNIVDDLNFSQTIMMNLWPSIWEDWTGEWNNQETPKHAYYDYVKYYEYNQVMAIMVQIIIFHLLGKIILNNLIHIFGKIIHLAPLMVIFAHLAH